MELQRINEFPYEVFPPDLMGLIEDANKTLNFPIEYFCSSILSAHSVAIGNSHMVKFKEGFIVKSNLYIALVGNAGDVKSHPVSFAFKPISEIDKCNYKKFKEDKEEYDNLPDDLKKSENKPSFKKSILNDFTPESLIKLHDTNPKGIAIVADELFGWINNFGRYSNSGEQETYLSLWNGSTISVDRKSQDPIRIENTHVNIIGTIQTKLLPKLGQDNRSNNGFIERMLFAANENPSPVLWSKHELDYMYYEMYYDKLLKIHMIEYQKGKPEIIELTEEAKKHLISWQNEQRNLYFEDDVAYGILAKYEVYVIRIALIIQLIFWSYNLKKKSHIELFAIENSIKTIEYFFQTALKINDKITKTNPISRLTKVEKELYTALDDKFTTKSAIEFGKVLELSERKIYRFLENKRLFTKERKGIYIKAPLK